MSIFLKALNVILGGPATLIADIYKRRMEIKAEQRTQERALRAALVQRQIDLIEKGLTADMNWEMEFAKQAATSWKDEYTLLVVSIPAVMSFVPGLDTYVKNGFGALGTTPVWYQGLLVMLFAASWGIRTWRRTQSDT